MFFAIEIIEGNNYEGIDYLRIYSCFCHKLHLKIDVLKMGMQSFQVEYSGHSFSRVVVSHILFDFSPLFEEKSHFDEHIFLGGLNPTNQFYPWAAESQRCIWQLDLSQDKPSLKRRVSKWGIQVCYFFELRVDLVDPSKKRWIQIY